MNKESSNTQSDPILSLRNVAAYYWRNRAYLRQERYWALKDVSLDLYHGESLGVVGRNGAGKSTLLTLMSGITRPDRGTIHNGGYRATLLSLQVGFMANLTGRDNAILSGMLMGLHKKEILSRLGEIQEFSGLGDFFEQPINTYSAGMKARLGFAVAYQLESDIVLVDELLGVGDLAFKKKSATVMHNMLMSDRTVVLVSNSPETIKSLCDRVVWIENGRTQAQGEPDEVLKAFTEAMADDNQPPH